ncbi:DUF2283 domain-containing protein [Rhodoferax sp. 4810]|uniref:DUF2283 domain-containing protein n=1 Tax=Thiospirillum jenense TaxID=1653858 RepID=A0A839HFD8_9GAMM|nr:DUF2283 domain-containing protein [Thiospirillum jenense]MBB1078018.1 DUF2283 domain-containing protein [Rhodoferax jenense]MBB1127361.1 DUF2283 domain-containing protein [Thiospirillum jenense]
MTFDYDPETDALYVRLSDAKIIESEEVQPGIILDFDDNGQVVAVEVLRVNQRRMKPLPAAA